MADHVTPEDLTLVAKTMADLSEDQWTEFLLALDSKSFAVLTNVFAQNRNPTECWLVVNSPGKAAKACGNPQEFYLDCGDARARAVDLPWPFEAERWLLTPYPEEKDDE